MLEVKNIISIARTFVAKELPSLHLELSNIKTGKVLYQVSQFIALEKDEIRRIDEFLERLDRFAPAVSNIAFDGGNPEHLAALVFECNQDHELDILALTVIELQTIVDDFDRQIRGSSRAVDTTGFDQMGSPDSDKDSPRSPKGKTDDSEKPSTWRDSLKDELKPNDRPDREAWKESLEMDQFRAEDPESWKNSLDDSGLDDLIARSAATDFDRASQSNDHGYHASLYERIETARTYLDLMKKVHQDFNTLVRAPILNG